MDDVQVLGSRTFIQAWGRARGLHTRIRLADGTWSRTTTRRTGSSFDVRVTPATRNDYLITWLSRSFALYSLRVQ